MSGTSLDGIDAVLVDITGSGRSLAIRQRAFLTTKLPEDIRSQVIRWYQTGTASLGDISTLNARLGVLFGRAALRCCRKAGVDPKKVDACGSHGFTIWHDPRHKFRSTMQIGEGAMIAQTTGMVTVSDFRQADIACGGEGAPLVPAFDAALFGSRRESRALLNIGGIANWTVIPKRAAAHNIVAWDLGPGNMVIDSVMRTLYGKPYDRGGRLAMSGAPSLRLMTRLLSNPLLRQRPPKSTGREDFGPAFVQDFLHQARILGLEGPDIVATATAFTAEAISDQYRRFVEGACELDAVIVSGGGAHNITLLGDLEAALPEVRIDTLDEHGMSPDSKEAIAFAWFTHQTLLGKPAGHPPATGAKHAAVLGKISLPTG